MHERRLTAAVGTALGLAVMAVAIVAICVYSVQADEAVAPFSVTSHDPPAHEVGVALNANVQATFDDDVNAGTVTSATFVVHGHMGGLAGGAFQYDGGTRTITLDPDRAFHAGEVLRVSATGGISSSGGSPLAPIGWQFTAGPVTSRSVAGFTDTSAGLPDVAFSSVAWGDYDNDGYLDILLTGASTTAALSRVYRNDGNGAFTDIGAGLTGVASSSVAWGDCDNDGDLDILLAGSVWDTPLTELYRNDGGGVFTEISAGLTAVHYCSAGWGDYDNDGDQDILLTGTDHSWNPVSKLYRNDGACGFTDAGANVAGVSYGSVAWGDHDNDGDLDMLLAGCTDIMCNYRASKVYRNDSPLGFTDTGAALTGVYDSSVGWGDCDNDGDLDILLTGYDGYSPVSKVYRNDGGASFVDIGAGLTGVLLSSAAWGDYDNDGDLDILLTGDDASLNPVSKVYRNDGACGFADIGAGLTNVFYSSVAWGDCDNDGDLDVLLTGCSDVMCDTPVSKVYRNNSRPKLGTVAPSSGSAPVGSLTTFTTTWSDPDGCQNLKQCYFHIGASPSLANNVTLMYNAVKDKLWLLDDAGTTWTGGHAPGTLAYLVNSQAMVYPFLTTVQSSGDNLTVTWTINFHNPAYAGEKKTGLKCKDRDKAKAKGRWKGTWTITSS